MATIPANRTEANLLRAFARELAASRRYLAFAARSEEEGHEHAAVVFRSVAQSRASHAEEHLKRLGDLADAHSASYASMARTARDEGLDEIAGWFEMLAKAGRSRAVRLQRALHSLNERGFSGFGT